jgi:hypothetical protein
VLGYVVLRQGEEAQPVFSLVEDLGDEDESGAVGGGRLEMDTSQFDALAVHQLGF